MKSKVEFLAPRFEVTEATAARVIRGHRLGPLKDGWIVFYEDRKSTPVPELVDELCVVTTEDDRLLIRYLTLGRKLGSFDLLTITGEAELDVTLKWAERVTWIRPHHPTPAEADHLDRWADERLKRAGK